MAFSSIGPNARCVIKVSDGTFHIWVENSSGTFLESTNGVRRIDFIGWRETRTGVYWLCYFFSGI